MLGGSGNGPFLLETDQFISRLINWADFDHFHHSAEAPEANFVFVQKDSKCCC